MPRTYEEIIAGLPEDERTVVDKWTQAATDKRITNALATYQANHPTLDEKGISARLRKIEEAHQAALSASDLRFHVYRECAEAGIQFDLVSDIPFPSKEAASEKIRQLAAMGKEQDLKTRNELLANSFRPGSGNGGGPREPAAFSVLTADERELAAAMRPDGSFRPR